ncbi:MAG: PAS domain-containing sensor histidine kinase [Verrucomicrobiota bacterium]|nr:PAS domain-containing sensor histidine kinase [Verrucomicrobiota bacterium]
MATDTYYASAPREKPEQLLKQVELISNNPVVDGLLDSMWGLIAVLNDKRQILAVNKTFMEMLGIDDLENTLGLRVGESLNCIHAHDKPAGCGTTQFCATCGAVVAMVTSLSTREPVERNCSLTQFKDGRIKEFYLRVRSVPMQIGDQVVLLLFIQDITQLQESRAFNRIFLHDVKNILTGLLANSDLLTRMTTAKPGEVSARVKQLALRLHREISVQQSLAYADAGYLCDLHPISLAQIIEELRQTYLQHPAADQKELIFPDPMPEVILNTDGFLLGRVLGNMLVNAMEASAPGDTVRLLIESGLETVKLSVWNRQPIPLKYTHRIFQRNFSTKDEVGRGLGTYSIKLFGEEYLGGTVAFSSSEAEGTLFSITLKL